MEGKSEKFFEETFKIFGKKIEISKENLEGFLKDEDAYFVKKLDKLHKKCMKTFLVTNNKEFKIKKSTLENLMKNSKKIQNFLKKKNIAKRKKSRLISLAQSQTENDGGIEVAEEDVKREELNQNARIALNKMVNLINKKFSENYRKFHMNQYGRISALGQINLGDKNKNTAFAQVLSKSKLNKALESQPHLKFGKKFVALASEYATSPNVQRALLRFKQGQEGENE